MRLRLLLAVAAAVSLLSGCGKLEYVQYDRPFVYFDGATTVNIDASGQVLRTYNIKLSTQARKEPVDISLSVTSGDGLQQGVDYEIQTGSSVSFLPGIYTMPMRIQWLKHPVDPSKDCSLTVRIESCNREDVCLGIPGPAGNGRQIRFIKY